MAFDEGLATRLRDVLAHEPGAVEKRMFGCLVMMVEGTMAVGVYGDDLLVRTDPEQARVLLAEPGTRPFEMTRRPMRGWVVVGAGTCAEDDDLRRWVAYGVDHARGLPPR